MHCSCRRRPRCCSLLDEAHRSFRRENRRGMPTPAEQVVAGLAKLPAAAVLGDERAPGGSGCQDHSGVGSATAGWSSWNRREDRGEGRLDLAPGLLP